MPDFCDDIDHPQTVAAPLPTTREGLIAACHDLNRKVQAAPRFAVSSNDKLLVYGAVQVLLGKEENVDELLFFLRAER